MFKDSIELINQAEKVVIVQAENPDGDSLGSALALEEILGDLGKQTELYCPVDIPKHLRYMSGWDRVTSDFDTKADLAIIVDTSADILLGKVLESTGVRSFLETHPVIVIDHHASDSTLSFDHVLVQSDVVATGHQILDLSLAADWQINQTAANHMLSAILSDSLGLTTPNVTADSYMAAAKLAELGASSADIEERRREFMKKAPEILNYKAKLIERIEYYLDNRLAVVHVPFEEIQKYSDAYNPGALIGDELRLVEGVVISCVVKTYPDGKLTARLRASQPVAEELAGYFGGGGHKYAAGFRIYESFETSLPEIISAADKVLSQFEATTK